MHTFAGMHWMSGGKEKHLFFKKKHASVQRSPAEIKEHVFSFFETFGQLFISFANFLGIPGRMFSCLSDVTAIPLGVYTTYDSSANNFVGTQDCQTPPGHSAGRSDPNCPCDVRVLGSMGIFIFGETSCTWSGMHN